MNENKKKLEEAIEYFDNFVNESMKYSMQGVEPIKLVMHYNTIRNELSKLYVN